MNLVSTLCLCLPALLASVLLAAPGASADSWVAPKPTLASSPDGRWYVIVQPTKGYGDVRFQLVRRAKGAEPRQPPVDDGSHGAKPLLKPEPGDEVVARGSCHMPMELRCLDGGRGFLLFETYAQLGGKKVLELRDGQGKVVWTRGLADLFSADQIRSDFTQSVSSIWWYSGFWLDETAGEIGIVTKTKLGPGLLRVGLKDGKRGTLEPVALLSRLSLGTSAERIVALEAAEALQLPGLTSAVREAYEDASTPALARAHMAVSLHARGDERGRDFVADSARDGRPLPLRRYAAGHLGEVLGKDALPLLAPALGDEDWQLRRQASLSMQALGGAAVDTLIRMISDSSLDETARVEAAQVLWRMGAPAAPALAALEQLRTSASPKLARTAREAVKVIRAATSKQAPGK